MIERLTKKRFLNALDILRNKDKNIDAVLAKYGPPPMWERQPGFASLLFTILEQQVSLSSAKAVYDRLFAITEVLAPRAFLQHDDVTLRGIGFSRQKTQYCRNVATAILDGPLDLDLLKIHDDDTVKKILTSIKGIGPWTADIYLLHSLGRPDIWPTGDLALRVAVQEVTALPSTPSEDALQVLAEPYRPWRSVAARVYWHHYLSKRNRQIA